MDELQKTIHCLKVFAGEESCEECDIYPCDDKEQERLARVAISALQELQQYRQIGTLEECWGYKTHSQHISKLHNCNDCGRRRDCEIAPRIGGDCRINCYFGRKWRRREMERLTKRIPNPKGENIVVYTMGDYKDTTAAEMTSGDIRTVLRALAGYEDLEEQGLLLKLPCKVGDEAGPEGSNNNKCDKECRDSVFRRCIRDYGFSSQMDMAIEEMSELIKALLKWRRTNLDGIASPDEFITARRAIIDELADVRIMTRQMEILFQAEYEVEKRIDFKVQRQLKRLEGGEGTCSKGTKRTSMKKNS